MTYNGQNITKQQNIQILNETDVIIGNYTKGLLVSFYDAKDYLMPKVYFPLCPTYSTNVSSKNFGVSNELDCYISNSVN